MLEQSQQNLATLIIACGQGEQIIEQYRKTLCEQYDFSPRHFFSLVTSNNAITSRELQNFLSSHQIQASTDQVLMLIKQYSNLQDGRLDFEDFLQVVLPSADLPLRERVIDRPLIKTFAQPTLDKFLKVLQEEVLFQGRLEECKSNLYQAKDFSVYGGFDILTGGGKSWVDEEDLIRFLIKFGSRLKFDEFEAFLRRTDLEGDGIINYKEFLDFVVPFNVPQDKGNKKEADELKTPEKKTEKPKEPIEKNPELSERSEEIKENTSKPLDSEENKKVGKAERLKVTKGKSSEKKAEKDEKIISFEILELLNAIKLEETNRQNLSCISEVLFSDIQEVVSNNQYPEGLKRSILQEIEENQTEGINQILCPLDSDYQLNIVNSSSGSANLLAQKLIKLALEGFLQVQNLIETVLQRFTSVYGSGKERQVSFDSEFILKSISEINACVLDRDLNLLLNRLDLTE